VQLIGGSPERQAIELDDPVAVAQQWNAAGFKALHVVDLDAAMRVGANTHAIESIVAASRGDIQVGGGVRTTEAVGWLIERGADRVIVGTRGLEDVMWLRSITALFPGRIVLAMDVRDRAIVADAWRSTVDREISAQLSQVASLALAGVLVTAVHVEGQMNGPDVDLIRDVVSQVPFQVQASGGITSLDDVIALRDAGASAAIVGMALYTGRLDPKTLPENFKS
jgi:phosphoribosylformimino-5-aminoimidazole carboxamide ribotide isomerase